MKLQILISIIACLLLLGNFSQAQNTASHNAKKKKNNPIIYGQGEPGSPKAAFNITATSTNTCPGLCDGTITISLSGGTPPTFPVYLKLRNTALCPAPSPNVCQSVFNLNAIDFPYTFTGLCGSVTAYSVQAKDADSTVRNASNIGVVEKSDPIFYETIINPTCADSCNGNIDIYSIDNFVYPVDYTWNRGDAGINEFDTVKLSNVCAGTWIVTITDNEGCVGISSYDVTEPVVLTVAVDTGNVSCKGLSDAFIHLVPAGGTSPYTYAWAHGPIAQDLNGLSPGNYTVTVTDLNGCFWTRTFYLTEPDFNFSISINSFTNPTCPTLNDGTITAQGVGGTWPYTWNINGGAFGPDSLFSGLTAGSYSIDAYDTNNCHAAATADQDLVNPPLPTLTIGNNGPLCEGQTLNLTSSAAPAATYSYSWTGPNFHVWPNTQNPSVPNVTIADAGTYNLTVTNITTGCWADTFTVVTINPIPDISANPSSQTICSGDATNIALSSTVPGATFSWTVVQNGVSGASNGSGNSIIQTLTYTGPPGTATYTITPAASGCTGTPITVVITVNPVSTAPTAITATVNPLCLGSSTTLSVTGGSLGAGATWQWYTGICNGTSVGSGASISVSPVITTSYYVNAVGTCNTTTCANLDVTVNTLSTDPTSISATVNPVCIGSSTTLTVVGGSLGTSATWEWYTVSCGGTSVGSGASIVVSPVVNTTYYVRAEGTCNTTNCVSLLVTPNTLSTDPASISATVNPVCIGSSTTLNVVGGSLGTGAVWQWYTGSCGGTSVGTGASIIVSPVVNTTYYVRAEGNCNTTNCASLLVTPSTLSTDPVSITATINPVCSGSPTTLSVVGGSLGTGATWQWYSGGCGVGGGGVSVGSGASIVVSPVANTTYYVRAEGTCNTTNCVSLLVSISTLSTDPASISATANPVCIGSSTTLSVVGGSLGTGATWQWYTGSCGGTSVGSGASIVVSPVVNTTYYVRAEGNCNTTNCASLLVTPSTLSTDPASISATVNPVCIGSSTTLSVVGGSLGTGAVWQWYTGSCGGTSVGSGASIVVSPVVNTTYYVRAEGTCNTTNCASLLVSISTLSTDPASISATANPVCIGSSTTLSVDGGSLGTGATWEWYTGSCGGTSVGSGASIVVSPVVNTTYYVRAEGNCNTTNCASLLVTPSTLSTDPASISATVNPVCIGSSTTLSVVGGSLGTGAVWQWYTGSCGGTSVGSGVSIVVSPVVNTTYYVRAEGNCNTTNCASLLVSISTLSTDPASISATANPVCIGSSTTLSVVGGSLGTGATWEWYTGSCGGTSVGSGASIVISPVANTTYYVRAEGNCNTTNCASLLVSISTLSTDPASISATANPVCIGSSTTLSVVGGSLGTGATWEWYTVSCGGTSIGSGASIVVSPVVNTTYYVRAEGNCNTTNCASLLVSVSTLSTDPASISATVNPVCSGSPTTLSVVGGSLGTGATWQWYTGSCGGTSVGSGASIVVSPVINTTYYVRAEGTCNTTNCASLLITINTLSTDPVSIIATVNPICPGSSTTLSVNGGSLGTGAVWQWYTVSCGGTSVGTGASIVVSPMANTTYYVRAEGTCNNTSCASLLVNVNATPTITNTTPGSRCGAGTVVLGAIASAGTINWYAAAVDGASLGTGTSFTTPIIAVTTTYYVDATNSGCTSTPRVAVTATIYTVPTVSAGNNSPVCIGTTLNLTSSAVPVDTYTYSWNGPVSPNPFDTSLQNTSITPVTANASGTYTIIYTSSTTNCTGSTTTVVNLPLQLSVDIIDTTMSCGSLPTVVAGIKFIPDGQGQIYSTSITQVDFAPGQIITSANDILSICAKMEHSWMGDLRIRLKCPNNNSITLKNFGGGNVTLGEPRFCGQGPPANLNPDICSNTDTLPGTGYSYCWDPTSSITMNNAPASYHIYTDLGGQTHGTLGNQLPYLPSADYKPDVSFGGLIGCPLNGTWSIEVEDNAGLDNGYIFEWQLNFNPTIFPDEFCNGSIISLASGGTGQVSYLWDYNNETTPGIDSLCARWYHVTVTDAIGCTDVDSAEITNVDISLVMTQTDPLCNGSCNGTATVTPAGSWGFTYLWCNGDTLATADSLCIGECAVTVTDQNSCHKYDTVTITQPTPLTLNQTFNGVPCNGGTTGSIILVGGGGTSPYQYSIETPPSWFPSGTFLDVTTGNYTPQVKDANGCITIGTLDSITNPAAIPIDSIIVTHVTCFDSTNGTITVYAHGGSGPLTYLLNPGGITNDTGIFTNLSPITYTVSITDPTTCDTVSGPIVITAPTQTTVIQSQVNESPCFSNNNGSITLTASNGTPPYTYTVGVIAPQTSAGAVTFTPLAAGNYNITVTDANLCPANVTTPMTITEPPVINATAALNNLIKCHGDCDATIVITASGGTGQLSYSIDGGTNWQVGNGTFSNLCAATYTLSVKDDSSCTANPVPSTITVTEPDSLIITDIAFSALTCDSTTTTITVTATGGTLPYNFQLHQPVWNQTGDFPNEPAGTDTILINDFNFCAADSIFTITPPTGFTLDSSFANVSCHGFNDAFIEVSVTGGASPYDYVWSNGISHLGSLLLSDMIEDVAPGLYTCIVEDINSCTDSISITITEPDTINIDIDVLDAHCDSSDGEASITITGGTGALTLTWLVTPPGGSDNPATNLPFGQYPFLVTDDNSCESNDTALINNINAPVLSFTNIVNNTCFGDSNGSATVVISGPYNSVIWDHGDIGVTAINLPIGNYWVTVTDNAGCMSMADTNITEAPEITFTTFTTTDVSCFGLTDGSLTVVATGGTGSLDYNIGNGPEPSPILNLTCANDTLTVTDDSACSVQRPFTINCPPQIVILSENITNTTCYGMNNGIISVYAEGGSGDLGYILYQNGQPIDSSLTGIFTSLPADTFNVIVVDTNNINCWIISPGYIIPPVDSITTAIVKVNPDCGATNGSITLTPSGGTPGYTYAWSIAGTSNSQINLGVGTYTCNIIDLNNCPDSVSVTLVNPAAGIVTFHPLDTIFCNGDTTGKFYYTISGGQSPFGTAWSVVASHISGDSLINLGAGTYSLTITDSLNCVTIKDTTLADPDSIDITNITVTNITCYGNGNGSVNITATGGTIPLTYYLDIPADSNITGLFTPLTAGNYNFTIRDANRCFKIAPPQTITEPDSMSFAISTQNSHCSSPDGQAQISVTGGTPGYFYNWYDHLGETGTFVTNLAFGTYHVEVTDSNNCVDTATVQIIDEAPGLLSFINISQNKCFGVSTACVTASLTGAPFPVTYSWNLPSTDSTICNLPDGFYIITTADSAGCQQKDTIEITSPPQIILNHTDTNLLCFGNTNGSITGAASGGVGGYWYYLGTDSNQTGYFPGLIADITDTLSVRDTNECQVDSIITLTQPPALSFTAAVSYPDCGVQNGDICLTVTGGTPPYIYQWQNTNWTADSTRNCILNLISGAYMVTVTDQNGCTKDTAITLTNPNAGGITFSPVQNNQCFDSCNGSATAVMNGGNPPFTYIWSNGDTGSTADSLCTGFYTVTVTDLLLCMTTDTVEITAPPAIIIDAQITTPIYCNGNNGVITVTASGGTNAFSYQVNGPPWLQNVSFDLPAGIYTITARDSNHCVKSATPVNLTQPPAITFNSTFTDITCNGSANAHITVTASGGTSSFVYGLNGSGTDPVADYSDLGPASYYVVATDANLCRDTAGLFVVTNPALLVLTPSSTNTSSCQGSDGSVSVAVSGGSPIYSYLWDDLIPSTTPTVNNLSAGCYQVTVTDSRGCSDAVFACINDNGACPVGFTGITGVNCWENSDGSATVLLQGNCVIDSIYWIRSGETTNPAIALPGGTNAVNVTDVNGCISSGTVEIETPDSIRIDITSSNVNCFGGNSGIISFSVTGGTPNYQYSINGIDFFTTQNFTGLSADIYQTKVKDANGCQKDGPIITITEPDDIILSAPVVTNINCFGECTGSIALTATGGLPPYQFTITGFDPQYPEANFNGLCAGTYTVTVTDMNGCQKTSAPITVTQNSEILLSYDKTLPACGGNDGSITVHVTGGVPSIINWYSYHWDPGDFIDSTIINLSAGLYYVTVTDSLNCSKYENPPLSNSGAGVIVIDTLVHNLCFGLAEGSVTATIIGGQPNYSYRWTNGDSLINTANISDSTSNLAAGIYGLEITDFANCVSAISFEITEPDDIQFTLDNVDSVSCYNSSDGSFSISAQGGTPGYLYGLVPNPPSQYSGTFVNLAAGTYQVQVTDTNNCQKTSPAIFVYQPNDLIITSQTDSSDCQDTNGFAVAIVTTGGTIPYTYLWDANANNQPTQTAINLGAGTYQFTVTDAHSCSKSDVAIVSDKGSPQFIFTDVAGLNCNGDSSGTATVVITSGVPTFQYHWDNNQQGPIATNLDGGVHSVTVTDGNGCESPDTIMIQEPDSMAATAVITSINCYGDDSGKVQLSITGGTPPFSYSRDSINWEWNGGLFTEVPAGTYSVWVRDTNECIAKFTPIVVTENPQMLIAITVDSATCTAADGSITVAVTGGVPDYTYLWDNGLPPQPMHNNVPANTYHVTVTDILGCDQNFTVPLSNINAGSLTINPIVHVNCFGDSTGTATALNTGGTPPFTYSWELNSQPISDITQTADSLSVGVISVETTDSIGCILAAVDTIRQPDEPILMQNPIITNVLCFGESNGSIAVTASGGTPGYIYIIGTDTNSTGIFTLPAGNYIITINDTLGCSKQSNIIPIIQPEALSLDITSTPSACNLSVGTAIVTISGGTPLYNILWSTGETNDTIINLPASIDSVFVTDANGCTKNGFALITDSNAATISFDSITHNKCFEDSTGTAKAIMTGGTLPFDYFWNNDDVTEIADSLWAGIHWVSVTDSIGCVSIDSLEITQPDMLQATSTLITDANCYLSADGAIETILSGGTAPYIFNYGTVDYTTSDTLFAENLSAGSYIITVADSNDCVYTIDTINVGQPTDISLSGSFTSPTNCDSANGTATVVPSGGSPGYTYLWDDNNQTTPTAINLDADDYWVTVTDSHACRDSLNVAVSDLNAATITFAPVMINKCFGDSGGSITASTSGGTSPFEYLWNIGDTTLLINNLIAGFYQLKVTDSLDCKSFQDTTLIDPAAIILSLVDTNSVSCYDLNNGSITVSATFGTPGYLFTIDTTSHISPIFTGLAGGTYTVIVKDTNGCVKTLNNIIINTPDSIHVVLTKTNPTCSSGTTDGAVSAAVTGGSPAYTYLWTGGITNDTIKNISGGTYYVTVTDQRLCTKTDSASILGTVEVYANAGPDTSICKETPVVMNGEGGDSYKWIPPLYLSSDIVKNPTVNALETTTYFMVATIGLCNDTDTVIVNVKHIDPVDAGADVTMLVGESTILTATCSEINPVYQWTPTTGLSNPAILTPTVDIETTTYYYISATSTNGCISKDSVKVTVIPRIQFAEGLSPNGDGINDTWVIRYHEFYTDINVSVYNRWGELLFYNKGGTEYWDGKFKGKELPVGTYYYVITVQEINGKVVLTGPVSIIK